LGSYVEFYSSIEDLADEIAICPFDSVLDDPAFIPRALNRTQGSDFSVGKWNDDVEREIKQGVADHHNQVRDGLDVRLPLPSRKKDSAKARFVPLIEREPAFDRAQAVYGALVGASA
jgi:hypothetical protein